MIKFRNFASFKLISPQFQPLKRNSSTVEPVRLAYASYESTRTPSPDEPAPLIVKHGLFGSKSNWNSLCKVLHQKTTRKVIAVDARNHGDSPHADQHTYEHLVTDVRELVDQLGIGKTALMGHSMGGRAMMYFALKYPDLVEKLIVADISPVTTSPNLKMMPNLFSALQSLSLPRDVPMSTARVQVDSQLAKVIGDKGLRTFMLTNLVRRDDGSYTWRINIRALMLNFDEIARFPETDDLKYSGPVLFLGGGASDFIQKSDHPEILKLFPRAEFMYIEGAGHWVHSERPSEFLQHSIEFLNKTP